MLKSFLFCGAIAASSLYQTTHSTDIVIQARALVDAPTGRNDWEEFGLIKTTEDEREEAIWSWFTKAWAALLKKYDDKQDQAYEHLNQLGCASGSDAADMLALYNAFTQHFKLPNLSPNDCTVINTNTTRPPPVVPGTNTNTGPVTQTPTSRTQGDNDFIQMIKQIDFSKEKQSLEKTKTSVNSTINQPEVGFTKKEAEIKIPVPVPASNLKDTKAVEIFGKDSETITTAITKAPPPTPARTKCKA